VRCKSLILTLSILLTIALYTGAAAAGTLKTHGIFSSNMVIQRDKPIVIWGWAEPGTKVAVQFGEEKAEATADGAKGRWEVTFPAREADATGRTLTIASGHEKIEMENIVIGDVWVMNGQSNMAFGLGAVYRADMEIATSRLPLLRGVRITSNEQYTLQEDLPAQVVSDWTLSSPETAGGYSAIGYAFASRLQRALNIPVGIIDNARGGAAIESLTPRHKFDDHPLTAKYAAWVEKRRAEFDWDAAIKPLIEKWEKTVAEQRAEGVAEHKLPPKPTRKDLRSWGVPGRSPMDAGACYNGMFGVFKGLNIKGALFHQGYNNAAGDCRPKRYRVLMKLMVEGWREDFNDPKLPVGVIEFCAGSISQIDGQPVTVDPYGPLELPCEPGEHRVVLTRPGFQPFEQTVTLAEGERQVVEPVWQPEPPTSKPDEIAVAEPPTPPHVDDPVPPVDDPVPPVDDPVPPVDDPVPPDDPGTMVTDPETSVTDPGTTVTDPSVAVTDPGTEANDPSVAVAPPEPPPVPTKLPVPATDAQAVVFQQLQEVPGGGLPTASGGLRSGQTADRGRKAQARPGPLCPGQADHARHERAVRRAPQGDGGGRRRGRRDVDVSGGRGHRGRLRRQPHRRQAVRVCQIRRWPAGRRGWWPLPGC